MANKCERITVVLKIGRSAVRPRPWPLFLTCANSSFLDFFVRASSQLSARTILQRSRLESPRVITTGYASGTTSEVVSGSRCQVLRSTITSVLLTNTSYGLQARRLRQRRHAGLDGHVACPRRPSPLAARADPAGSAGLAIAGVVRPLTADGRVWCSPISNPEITSAEARTIRRCSAAGERT